MSLTLPCRSTMKLLGLMSRWIMWRWCSWEMAWAMVMQTFTLSTGVMEASRRLSERSTPLMRSISRSHPSSMPRRLTRRME